MAQAILTSIGYLPLLNALIDLWQTRAEKGRITEGLPVDIAHSERKLKWVKYVGWYVGWCLVSSHAKYRFLRALLLASLATAIAAGVILGRDLSDERRANLIRNLLKASYIVSLGKSDIDIR